MNNSVMHNGNTQKPLNTKYGIAYQNTGTTIPDSYNFTPAFKGENIDTTGLTPLETDKTDFSATQNNTKEKSKVKKYLIYANIGLAGLIGTALCFMHRDASHIKRLYKENLILSNLPEKIEFKEAKTLEEAIKFAKETLGIKQVDKEFTLDALNIANKGIVDVSNANKGKLFLPRALHFASADDKTTIAWVRSDIKSKDFGSLNINRKYFDDKFLTKRLDEYFRLRDFEAKTNAANNTAKAVEKRKRSDYISMKFTDEHAKLFERYKQDAENLSLMEKRKLFGIIQETHNVRNCILEGYPLTFLKKNLEHFKTNGININMEEIEKMSRKERSEKLEEILKNLAEKAGNPMVIQSQNYIQEKTIYHELGHLQDFAKNLQELDMKTSGLDIFTKKYWTNPSKNNRHINEISNRWLKIWKNNNYSKLLDEKPETFKKLYPDAYEFATNKEYQEIAGQISSYAQSGIGEFIAECYAKMIVGEKLPKNVMELYEKYKGPLLT